MHEPSLQTINREKARAIQREGDAADARKLEMIKPKIHPAVVTMEKTTSSVMIADHHSNSTAAAAVATTDTNSWTQSQSLIHLKRRNATVIAATSAAVVGVTAGYPFDLVKTRMQTIRYPSASTCISEISKREGLIGFYQGVGPILVTVSFLRSISFTVYDACRTQWLIILGAPDALSDETRRRRILSTFESRFSSSSSSLSSSSSSASSFWSSLPHWTPCGFMPGWQILAASALSGGAAGGVVASLNAPMEFIKIQRQLENAGRSQWLDLYTSEKPHTAPAFSESPQLKPTNSPSHPESSAPKQPLSAYKWAIKIVRAKGVLGLYSGYPYHLLRDVSGTGMYFFGYESFKHLLSPKDGSAPGSTVFMLAGGLSGTFSWIVLYPIDSVKSIMQREALNPTPKYTSAMQFVKRRLQNSGIRGFYHGVGAQLTRSFPVHSLNFLVYESVLKWCRS